jgi:hypothetical protein
LLCAKFNLPLSYGGWRLKKLSDLGDFLEVGFKAPRRRTAVSS